MKTIREWVREAHAQVGISDESATAAMAESDEAYPDVMPESYREIPDHLGRALVDAFKQLKKTGDPLDELGLIAVGQDIAEFLCEVNADN